MKGFSDRTQSELSVPRLINRLICLVVSLMFKTGVMRRDHSDKSTFRNISDMYQI